VRVVAVASLALVVAFVALAYFVVRESRATLSTDPTALARLQLKSLAGTLREARAYAPDGREIPLRLSQDRLTPMTTLRPGERITVDVTVRRPGWIGWALGSTHTEHLTVRAPTAPVTHQWLTVPQGSPVSVTFAQPVVKVAYTYNGRVTHLAFFRPEQSVTLGTFSAAGALAVAGAARRWERLPKPVSVTWFPTSHLPVAVVDPAPGSTLTPAQAIRLTFSRPVSDVLGTTNPPLPAGTHGSWRLVDSHTLLFHPTGLGAPLGSQLRFALKGPTVVTGPSGAGAQTTQQLAWTVPLGSTLRLHQLLAELGYLPLDWNPSATPVAQNELAQTAAAVKPPAGEFHWRYGNTPAELKSMWTEDSANSMTRGAVMTFENEHNLTADGLAGPTVWAALIHAALNGDRHDGAYSYVYVHRNVPQSLTLWSAGHVILTSPGNTGVPAAPTQVGTFPVFEHIPVGTMSGTNPDGSHYNDPGIRWISYFNGGDALHSFNRASFGTPQSLGCVELPLAAAAKVWPYTPIGTLVTIEN
jgi:peptidoglycan hydrolase-like protein with peptidoglycan-binding domain